MRVFFYRPEQVGLSEFPPGLMRLRGAQEVGPEEADVFVLPCTLHNVPKERIYKLPYLKGNAVRHVFWNCADDMYTWYDLPALFIRCDATQEILRHDPYTVGWPWPVPPIYREPEPFVYDVCFQGWDSTPLTNVVVESVRRSGLRSHLAVNHFFFGYHDSEPAYAHLKTSFLDTLSQSRLSLVPRSIPGVIRYRLLEAMAMGRVPVSLCDDVVWPFPDEIDWTRCCVMIKERDAENVGAILTGWLSCHSDDEIRAMGEYGHRMFNQWLHRDKWDDLFPIAVERHLTKVYDWV